MDPEGFRALFDGAARARLDRFVVRLTGESPLKFLHDVGTQDVADLQPGHGALTCFLDEKGRVQAVARVLALADGDVLLDAEPAAGEYLTGWLARIAPLSACEVIDESSSWTVTGVRGARAVLDLDEHAFEERDGGLIVGVSWGLPGHDVHSRTPATTDVDAETFEAARIAAGVPRFGIDITPESLVNETPLLARAVSMAKGCYPGQESVARVHNLGRIRRHLVGLRLTGAVPPAGASVLWDGSEVGLVTSAAATPDGAAAIARVKAEVGDGARVVVAGGTAEVRSLV